MSFEPSPLTQTSVRNMAGPGLRAFVQIMDSWSVNEPLRIRLLGVSRATYFRWKKAPSRARVTHDTLERLSYLLGIYKALQVLLPNPESADSWVQRPNQHALFGGRPPIERLAGGQVADLYVVRQYLDAQRGWN